MEDSMDKVMADVAEVFRFEKDSRPQDRAHAYLEEHKVSRGYNDTAMQRVAEDLVSRGYEIGRREAQGTSDGRAVALMTRMSGELLEAALSLRE